MSDFNKTGTEANLKDGPRSTVPGGFGGGTRQDTGTAAPLKSTASSNKFSTGGGTYDLTGTKASLGTTPQKGYTSANTPMSKRSVEQSK